MELAEMRSLRYPGVRDRCITSLLFLSAGNHIVWSGQNQSHFLLWILMCCTTPPISSSKQPTAAKIGSPSVRIWPKRHLEFPPVWEPSLQKIPMQPKNEVRSIRLLCLSELSIRSGPEPTTG